MGQRGIGHIKCRRGEPAGHARHQRTAAKRPLHVVGVVDGKRRQRIADRRGIGAIGLPASQAIAQHDTQLLVHEGQRLGRLRHAHRRGQLVLRVLHRNRHLGFAGKRLKQLVGPGVRHHRSRRRSGHLRTVRRNRRPIFPNRVQIVRNLPARQLIHHACRGVHIDSRRFAQLGQARDVIAKHLGRREIGRGAAEHRVLAGERRGTRLRLGRRAEVDEVQVERALVHLLLQGQPRGAHHDVARADVAVHEPAFHIPHARHQVEQVAAQTRRHQRAHAAATVDGKLPARAVQGDALDPFHDDARHPVDRAAAIQTGKALQPRQQDMAFVFALERGTRGSNAALMIVLGFAITTMRKREQLERQVLALRIARVLNAARAAAMPLALRHEQRDETAHIGRPIGIGKRKRRAKIGHAHQAHALNGARRGERAALIP